MNLLLLAALTLSLLAILFFAIGWYGSSLIFHSTKMLPLEIWPDRYGLSYETVAFQADDGLTLRGWLIPCATKTDRTILISHGWGDNKGDVLSRVHFLARGFNLFLFDFRHHGESEGSRSTIGCEESMDIEAALAALKRLRPEWAQHLGAFGLSMGAVLTIWAAARHPELKVLVLESPFASARWTIARWGWNEMRLPYFPATWATLLVARWRLGRDTEPFSPKYHAANISPRPSLFIVGSADILMPPEVVRSVFDLAPEPKEYWLVPDARHGKCSETAGPEYERRVAAFFDKHLS